MWVFAFTVENFIDIPNQLNLDMVVSDIMNIICEGDTRTQGARWAREILLISGNHFRFVDEENRSVQFSLYKGGFYRIINGSPEKIPYYLKANVSFEGGFEQERVFRYYDRQGEETKNPSQVKRVEISLVARMGKKGYNRWGKVSKVTTSIAIRPWVQD